MVARVVRRREQSFRQRAQNCGISELRLNRWLVLDEILSGDRHGVNKADAAEVIELKKRNKTVEEENLIFRSATMLCGKEMLAKSCVRSSKTSPAGVLKWSRCGVRINWNKDRGPLKTPKLPDI